VWVETTDMYWSEYTTFSGNFVAVSCPQVPVFILTLFKKNTYFIHSEKYGKIYVDVEGGKKENRKANQYVIMHNRLQI
jgi:hypothetical protein